VSTPKITKAQAKAAVEQTRPFAKLIEKRLPYDHIERELKGAVITRHADGKGLNVHDPTPDKRYLKRLHDMQSEYRALDYEIGQNEMVATYPEHERQGIRRLNGDIEVLPGHIAESKARKGGLRPVINWGRARSRTVVQPDGLHLVYERPMPGTDMRLVRAYRLRDNGNNTSSEVEVRIE
jgi:hypothetical protein